MNDISPRYMDSAGPAPRAVCARWLGNAPCGAHALWHIIWDAQMENGPVCDAHMAEARQRWVFLDTHPYSRICGRVGSLWDPSKSACFMPDEPSRAAETLTADAPQTATDDGSKAVAGTTSRSRRRATALAVAVGLACVASGPAGCAPVTREDCEAKGGTWRASYALMAPASKPSKRKTKPAAEHGQTRRTTYHCEGWQ